MTGVYSGDPGQTSSDPICTCGHRWSDHNKWWDIGMGCDLCGCDDSTVGL